MYLITFLAIIILISNSAFCYLSNGNVDVSVLPKIVNFPLDETAEFEDNDRSVYDPGVEHRTGKLYSTLKLGSCIAIHLHIISDVLVNCFPLIYSIHLNMTDKTIQIDDTNISHKIQS